MNMVNGRGMLGSLHGCVCKVLTPDYELLEVGGSAVWVAVSAAAGKR